MKATYKMAGVTLYVPTFALQGLQKEKRETGAKNVFEEIIAETSHI